MRISKGYQKSNYGELEEYTENYTISNVSRWNINLPAAFIWPLITQLRKLQILVSLRLNYRQHIAYSNL